MKHLFHKIFTSQNIMWVALLIAAIFHGWNMFGFPYYENDEGTYLSQAWSLLSSGQLAPYTYWYDHAPAGWILIAIWTFFTGGFFTFGASVNSGRVLMLILHVLSAFFIFAVTKRLSKSTLAAFVATTIFSITPLGIYFQRRVLLDNIMTFWVLFSLWCLIRPYVTLRHIILSAVAFGIGVLTKENAVFFLPAFLYVLWLYTSKKRRGFAFVYWMSIMAGVISLYFLYAIIKSEFFPVGTFGDQSPRVSLITTLQEQLSRGVNKPFWSPGSEFRLMLTQWINKDATLIIGGILAVFINLLLSIKYAYFRIPVFLSFLMLIFLVRGKLVIDFYILPLLPLLAINIALLFHFLTEKLSFRNKRVYAILASFILLCLSLFVMLSSREYFYKNETEPQIQTIAWIKRNLPTDTTIVIDDSLYVDLHAYAHSESYHNAEWAWKIEKDPEIRMQTIANDWKNIEYITLSHEVLKQIRFDQFPLTKYALEHSIQVADFRTSSSSYRDIENYISTNGDWMSIYKVRDKKSILLEAAWQHFKSEHVHTYGQIIDPATTTTTSTRQAEAMLKAVMLGDHDAFRGIFAWTKDHFGFRNDRLFSSEWGKVAQNEKVTDSESTSSADIQIAYSLLVAYERWGDEEYLRYAQAMLSDLWENGVVNRYGYMYIKSGTDSSSNSVDTASLQPNFFRKFQDYDKKHSWNQVAESSLQLASLLTSEEVIPGSFLITSSDSITPLDSINSAKALYIGVSLDNIHHPSSQAAEILSLLRSVDPHIADSSLKDGYYGVPNDLTDFTNNFMLTAIAIKEFPGL